MNPTTNSATNPNWSLRIAFSTMVACAAMLFGPQTYANECAAKYDAYLEAEQAVIDAHDANDDALADLAAARASGNTILIWAATMRVIFPGGARQRRKRPPRCHCGGHQRLLSAKRRRLECPADALAASKGGGQRRHSSHGSPAPGSS